MGNSESYISTSDSTSSSISRGTSSSTFEMIRQMSYESDVFYPDTNVRQKQQQIPFEENGVPELSLEEFPAWRTDDINPVLLKYMKRSYNPCPQNLKDSAKKLAELVAAQKVPKFISSFGGSQCINLHWACLAGWCMCRYQYQPLTPLHLMPHTRLTSSNVNRSTSLPSCSLSSEKSFDDDVTTTQALTLYDDRISRYHHDNLDRKEVNLEIMGRESTV